MEKGKFAVKMAFLGLTMLLLPECNCPPCEQDLQIQLPRLGENLTHPVSVEFRLEVSGPLLLRCSAAPLSGARPAWSCDAKLGSMSDDSYVYPGVDSERAWFLRVTGASGVREFVETSIFDGPNEAWPHQCVCDWHTLRLSHQALGIPLPADVAPGSGGAAGIGGSPAGTGGVLQTGGAVFGGAAGSFDGPAGAAGDAPVSSGGGS